MTSPYSLRLQITINLIIEKVRRLAHGFRNFDHYRLTKDHARRRRLTNLPGVFIAGR
jgi:hypothetical protein